MVENVTERTVILFVTLSTRTFCLFLSNSGSDFILASQDRPFTIKKFINSSIYCSQECQSCGMLGWIKRKKRQKCSRTQKSTELVLKTNHLTQRCSGNGSVTVPTSLS
jgi:hypothetical protein